MNGTDISVTIGKKTKIYVSKTHKKKHTETLGLFQKVSSRGETPSGDKATRSQTSETNEGSDKATITVDRPQNDRSPRRAPQDPNHQLILGGAATLRLFWVAPLFHQFLTAELDVWIFRDDNLFFFFGTLPIARLLLCCRRVRATRTWLPLGQAIPRVNDVDQFKGPPLAFEMVNSKNAK